MGSLGDALALEPLAARLPPIKPITAGLDLEPMIPQSGGTAGGVCAGHELAMSCWPRSANDQSGTDRPAGGA